jgi:hypothetical protein
MGAPVLAGHSRIRARTAHAGPPAARERRGYRGGGRNDGRRGPPLDRRLDDLPTSSSAQYGPARSDIAAAAEPFGVFTVAACRAPRFGRPLEQPRHVWYKTPFGWDRETGSLTSTFIVDTMASMVAPPKSHKKTTQRALIRVRQATAKSSDPLATRGRADITEDAANEATAFPIFVKLAAASLTDLLGHNRTAALLDVDKSRLTRCITGKENYGADLVRRIYNLHYIVIRALELMQHDEIGPWLMEPEPFLGGSVPINVLQLSGPVRVIQALEARAAGAFA